MDEDIPEYATRRVRLQPCQTCGRQFNADILSKHQSICRKVTTKKRKVFDAGKQRATDSDVPYKATKKTAMVHAGQIRPQDERGKPKANWREKHNQLIRSIREARSVTRAMKEGGPLPAFRPSEVPSDYVTCPFCRRNFNEHAAKRHMPFCQSQHEKKQPTGSRNNQPLNRGRTLPPQSSQYRQQQYPSSGSGGHGGAGGHDVYNNGYKHSNSAPMIVRRHPSEMQQPPPPPSQQLPPPQSTKNGGGGWSIRKFFGFGSKEEAPPPHQQQRYPMDDEDDYEPRGRYPPPQPQPQMMMRTGRTQENTNLNVRARNRSDDVGPYRSRLPPPAPAPSSSYGQTRSQYGNGNGNGMGNGQYNNKPMRPTAVGRPPPGGTVRCGDCGNMFTNSSARFCPHCGYRR